MALDCSSMGARGLVLSPMSQGTMATIFLGSQGM